MTMTFLGLDVGGSRCRYEWRPQGRWSGGDAVGVQPAVHGIEASADVLAEVLRVAKREVEPEACVIAMAGAGDPAVAETLRRGLAERGIVFPTTIVGDVLAAAAAALADGPGVLLWSGTGSFAVARGEDGELVRVGGRGYLLGDQGSGYDLVRRAAAAVVMAADGLGPPTRLCESLTSAVGAPAPERLGAALQAMDTGSVAGHLGVVLEAAAGGDAVASEVLEAGAESLVALAVAAARRVAIELMGCRVALGGGVLLRAEAFSDLVGRRLASLGAAESRLLDDRAAARGAAWLAEGVHRNEHPQVDWVRRVAL